MRAFTLFIGTVVSGWIVFYVGYVQYSDERALMGVCEGTDCVCVCVCAYLEPWSR